jgi:hypothetical protein
MAIATPSASAPPGERFIACAPTETGPSRWLKAILDEIPFVSLITAFDQEVYVLTLTNRSRVMSATPPHWLPLLYVIKGQLEA